MRFYAHFDKDKGIKQPLHQHLHAVATIATESVPPTIQFPQLTCEDIKMLVQFESYFHDLGKYTDFFQQYLLDGRVTKFKGHAHISACFIFSMILKKLPLSLGEPQKYAWAFLVYLSVRLHHLNLTLNGLFHQEEMWNVLDVQAENILKKGKEIYQDLDLNSFMSYEQFRELFKIEILRNNKHFFLRMPQHLSIGRLQDDQWFFALLYLFSVLIDSDKLDSAGLERNRIKSCPSERVVSYLCRKHGKREKTALIKRRERARNCMISIIDNLTEEELDSQLFFTITAPTGIGKTLTSLECSLRLQQRIQERANFIPRIITAIPFINIIEQTKADYEEVFEKQIRVITHHRFTDFSIRDETLNEEVPLDQRLLEVESWEADVVLTTFVQFFQSIFTGKNRLLKKINKLAGSIVILDEVQSLPDKYMPLIGALLRKLSQFYGTRFILMTATQPKLLEMGDLLLGNIGQKPIELLPDHELYFQEMKRTQFIPLLNERYNNDQFISLFLRLWKQNQAALIVVNTIKRSIDIFQLLKKKKGAGAINENVHLHYLSTNIVPKQRKEVINTVKEKLRKKIPLILVSTQTIEAGVDLDFDIGFRDLAPLESLVQTAGRINREGKKGEFAPLYIIQLETDHQGIYSLHHIDRTKILLKNQMHIFEPQYRQLIETYYNELTEAGIPDESRILWNEGVVSLDFEKLREFQLIKNPSEIMDVFVEFNGDMEPTQLANAYEELMKKDWKPDVINKYIDPSLIKEMGDVLSLYERKALLRLLSAKLSNYIVQVRIKRMIHNKPINFSARNGIEASFLWIPPDQLTNYYDMETGFKDESGEAFIW